MYGGEETRQDKGEDSPLVQVRSMSGANTGGSWKQNFVLVLEG